MAFNPLAKVQQYYSELWKAVVRPPRDYYDPSVDLGSRRYSLRDGRTYLRTDFEVTNPSGERILCSHHEPHPSQRPAKRLPCVIYLHGNCSSRVEAFCAIPYLMPLNITVVGFDFSGSGHSDGDWVTLGWKEQKDLAAVIDYLRENRNISTIALWGRSMGAVTALLHARNDATIMGMVCDSPFSNLRKLAEETATEFLPFPVPKLVISPVLNLLRSTISSKTELDIDDLDIIPVAQECDVPVMFVTGRGDNFVRSHHARMLYNGYRGEKWLVTVNGDHNSPRSSKILYSTAIFFYNTLQCQSLFEAENLPLLALRSWMSLAENCQKKSIFQNAMLNSADETEYSESEFDEDDSDTGHPTLSLSSSQESRVKGAVNRSGDEHGCVIASITGDEIPRAISSAVVAELQAEHQYSSSSSQEDLPSMNTNTLLGLHMQAPDRSQDARPTDKRTTTH